MKTIIANWKMNVGVRESVALARATLLTLRGRKTIPDLVICPPFVALSEVRKVVARSAAALGAQNVFWESNGAYTGEISTRMLAELGVSHVIIGHSERRALGETDEMIGKKMRQALAERMVPILCVGESAQENDAASAREVISRQLRAGLEGARLHASDRLFVAYEPVWAIGTGEFAAVGDVVERHQFIRSVLGELFSDAPLIQIQVLYGGSVDGENAYGFLRERDVDGVLVGGASVRINQFKDIVGAAAEVVEAQQSE